MHKQKAFTIVELVIVISIIAILATLIVAAYSSIGTKANVASLQSTLGSNKKLLANYFTVYGSYPLALDGNYCPILPSVIDNAYCLEAPGGTTLSYSASAQSFSLHATSGSTTYKTTDSLSSIPVSIICPVGFIAVLGSTTYGTSDFCVMKYEAKVDDNADGVGDTNQNSGYDSWPANSYPISTTRKLVSTPTGYSVAYINQITAISVADSANNMVYNCSSGCHLISDAEWMTIAQNVSSVPSNWSGGAVGSGYIYSGHNDNSPAKLIQADTNDNNGYVNTNNSSGNQRRTLQLTNGETIWDFAGNISEWTSGQTSGGQPGLSTSTGFAWRQWPTLDVIGSLVTNPFPSNMGLSGANSWTTTNGIGAIYSSTADTTTRGLFRGGSWLTGTNAGLLGIYFGYTPSNSGSYPGMRVAK